MGRVQHSECSYRPAGAWNTIHEWKDSYYETIWYNPFPTENIEQYLDKDITKQELAKQFLSVQNVIEREKYFQAIKDTNSLMQTYQQMMEQAALNIQLLHHLREVFDDNILQRLELVQKLETVQSLGPEDRLFFYELRKIVEDNIKKLDQIVTDPLFDILFKIKTIETNLREYNDSIEMDSQFYLWVLSRVWSGL